MPRMPIKYVENNLLKNIYDEWWAYYCIEPYNYSFCGEQEKLLFFNRLRQMIGQTRDGNIHMLQISTQESIREAQERSKQHIVGSLQAEAEQTVDYQTRVLVDGELLLHGKTLDEPPGDAAYPFRTGETQIDYKYYIGFKLLQTEEAGIKNFVEQLVMLGRDFAASVNKNMMGDYQTVSDAEFERYSRIEKLIYSKISRMFDLHRLSVNETGYIVEHIYGCTDAPYEQYTYTIPYDSGGGNVRVKQYDIEKLGHMQIREYPKHMTLFHDNGEKTCCAYLTISDIVGELEFPGSEILYYQQAHFDFPVDTSINIEILPNKKALSEIRKKKKKIEDYDEHAFTSGSETGGDVMEALSEAKELETDLSMTKDSMYIMSYILRVSAPDEEELKRRCNSLVDYYDDFNIKLVRPSGDMMNFHIEFIPSAKRMNGIKKYVKSDFLACLGFGASELIGEKEGIAIGHTKYSERFFYLKPWLAAQGVKGTVTNSLSAAFIGSLGGGKSFNANLLIYLSVLYGARAVIIDPKSERGVWKEKFPALAPEINITNLTSDIENKGMLDPFVIMRQVKDSETLALDILTYLLGVTIQDNERYPALRQAVRAVAQKEKRGLLLVIDELRGTGTDVSNALAGHIESFMDTGLAQLLFSDGSIQNTISIKKRMNIIQIADLTLPEKTAKQSEYSTSEMLSVAMMIVISTFCLDFIHSDTETFKIVNLDEAWSVLNVSQGKILANKLVREGRAMNAGIYFCTQSSKDVSGEAIKNNIGMFFISRSNDMDEVKNSLRLIGVDAEDENNQDMVRSLENGECVMKDIRGHVNAVKYDALLYDFFLGFDTRPKLKGQAL